MFNNFLSALEDYIDLRIEQSQETLTHRPESWHDSMRTRRIQIEAKLQDAFNDAVENLIPRQEPNDY